MADWAKQGAAAVQAMTAKAVPVILTAEPEIAQPFIIQRLRRTAAEPKNVTPSARAADGLGMTVREVPR